MPGRVSPILRLSGNPPLCDPPAPCQSFLGPGSRPCLSTTTCLPLPKGWCSQIRELDLYTCTKFTGFMTNYSSAIFIEMLQSHTCAYVWSYLVSHTNRSASISAVETGSASVGCRRTSHSRTGPFSAGTIWAHPHRSSGFENITKSQVNTNLTNSAV